MSIRIKHLKRGTTYLVTGEEVSNLGPELIDGDQVYINDMGIMQLEPDESSWLNLPATVSISGIHPFNALWTLYMSETDNRLWVRPTVELHDTTRFERIE